METGDREASLDYLWQGKIPNLKALDPLTACSGAQHHLTDLLDLRRSGIRTGRCSGAFFMFPIVVRIGRRAGDEQRLDVRCDSPRGVR